MFRVNNPKIDILFATLTIVAFPIHTEPNQYQKELELIGEIENRLEIKNPEMFPSLFNYVEKMCKKNDVAMPSIWIDDRCYYNSAGGLDRGHIYISSSRIEELTADELEASITHEIGHIKHKHVLKKLLMYLCCCFPSFQIIKYCTDSEWKQALGTPLLGLFLSKYLIGKKFEQQADQFALENGKAVGLAQMFRHAIENDEEFETNFEDSEFEKWLIKLYSNLYHHTFLGDHPPLEERLKAAQDYLKNTNQSVQ